MTSKPRQDDAPFPTRRERRRAEKLAAAAKTSWAEQINWPMVNYLLAAGGAFLIPARYDVINGVSFGLVYLVALIPVWFPTLARFRGARPILYLGLLALISGVALSIVNPGGREFSRALMQGDAGLLLLFLFGIGFLLWSRETTGLIWTTSWFALGTIVAGIRFPSDLGSPWKYSFGIGVSIAVLAFVSRGKPRPSLEVPTALVLAAVFALSDSRSIFGILVVATLIAALQVVLPPGSGRMRGALLPVTLLAILGSATYRLAMWAINAGYLGEAARQRTIVQSELSGGNLLAGGRPEMGASINLISAQPWGYGNGLFADAADIELAKLGMADAAGRVPDDGYVDNFMFTFGFTLHSTTAEFWVRYGLVGLATILVIVAVFVFGVLHPLARRELTIVTSFAAFISLWNLAFTPAAGSLYLLAISVAIVLQPTKDSDTTPLAEDASGPSHRAGITASSDAAL